LREDGFVRFYGISENGERTETGIVRLAGASAMFEIQSRRLALRVAKFVEKLPQSAPSTNCLDSVSDFVETSKVKKADVSNSIYRESAFASLADASLEDVLTVIAPTFDDDDDDALLDWYFPAAA